MGDDQIVISSGPVITPEMVMSQSFTSAFRGFHPVEVRQFLKRVSDEMAAEAGREVELRRALQEALARAAHPELDEATLTGILGEHAARLLASARDTASSILDDARREAEALVQDAEKRVARMREEADGLMARRVAEADASADSIQHAAEVAAQAHIEKATLQGKDMVGEARAVRERMLGDLNRRRRTVQVQIEQLLAARERLVAAYDVVRRTVEEATAELDAAEPEARLAAEAVARRAEELEPGPQSSAGAPPEPERRRPPEPAPSLLRRIDTSPPPAAQERPRLRPQTVAGAVAGRSSAPAVAVADPPAGAPEPDLPQAPVHAPPPPPAPPASPVPSAPPAPAPAPVAPMSDLATGEVPVVMPDGPTADVGQLFARIRADRVQPATEAPASEPAPAVDPIVGERALEGRDDLLDNLEAGLTRALKRVLGDEQNEVLDSLRRLGPSAGDRILPDSGTQTAGYRDAALPWLQQAVRAGAGFVSDPGAGSGPDADASSLEAQGEHLARELVEPLRQRLVRALEGGADADDPSVVAESMRSAYRQWKVQQVEECVRHHVVVAFNLGAFAATPEVATLQWLVGDDGHCPDCDDNALAGPTAKGQPFPTGQLHPPAHPGCRCLLVPVSA